MNYWLLLLAAVANFVLGALWYSPLLFGKQWIKAQGFSKAKEEALKKKPMAMPMVINFLTSILMVVVISFGIHIFGIGTMRGAIAFAFAAWAGFMIPAVVNPVLWAGESVKVGAINAGFYLVGVIIVALIV
jgi:hypothetical protein